MYINSLNCVQFARKCTSMSRRQINKTSNAESKLQLREILLNRQLQTATTDFEHVRSHANSHFPDAAQRKRQNVERFGDRARHIEEMNDKADTAANTHLWTNIPYPLQLCNRQYVTIIHKQVVTQHPGKKWKEAQYKLFRQDWKKRQPVRTLFMNPTVDTASLPRKHEHYANLTCKILTGTIWTAKLKKRLKLQENDTCLLCATNTETHIEDAEHALGKCRWTQQRNDEVWEEIIQLGKNTT